MARSCRCWALLAVSSCAALLFMAPGCSLADQGDTWRVSVSSSGEQGGHHSGHSSLSADGRYVAFDSLAWNLVTGDTNSYWDIFVHDGVTRETERVSVSSSGEQGSWDSYQPSISGDGRYVAFESHAPELVAGDTNGCRDVFVHDRVTRETVRVSVSSAGEQGNADSGSHGTPISADGRYVAFESLASNLVPGDTTGRQDIFTHDRVTGETVRVSVSSAGEQGNSDSYYPSISADGRYVALLSGAWNLVPGDTNGCGDVFMHQCLSAELAVPAPDGWLNPGWNWFSIPLDPAGSTIASDLLGFACRNILYLWNSVDKNLELYPDDFMDLTRGRGYLLRLASTETPSYDAYPPAGDFDIALPEAGWTWIGQPFDHDTLLADCVIRNNGIGQSRTPAQDRQAADPWLNWNFLWWHSGEDSWKILSLSGGDDDTLHPWYGYMVWANTRYLSLIVPAE
jgi:Tol biopolymer transport system component